METRGKLYSNRREHGPKRNERERRLRHIYDFILFGTCGVAQRGRGKGSWTETPRRRVESRSWMNWRIEMVRRRACTSSSTTAQLPQLPFTLLWKMVHSHWLRCFEMGAPPPSVACHARVGGGIEKEREREEEQTCISRTSYFKRLDCLKISHCDIPLSYFPPSAHLFLFR